MLKSIEGVFRNGHVELAETPNDVSNETRVIVTFGHFGTHSDCDSIPRADTVVVSGGG